MPRSSRAGRRCSTATAAGTRAHSISAVRLADAFGAPLHAATTTRLLVDLNRSIGHRNCSRKSRAHCRPARRQDIVDRHYRPHRQAVEADIARLIASGRQVIHVASHSFTPTLDDVPRHADVAWLYDPADRAK